LGFGRKLCAGPRPIRRRLVPGNIDHRIGIIGFVIIIRLTSI
jgi:hypothetical protein